MGILFHGIWHVPRLLVTDTSAKTVTSYTVDIIIILVNKSFVKLSRPLMLNLFWVNGSEVFNETQNIHFISPWDVAREIMGQSVL
jgi:hypothetical protein